ncbi:MAG: GFA family protein [Proteobacteria bacterium]|nr:GFA family protein [Pseudomonadota bacterium]MDA1310546.1 GFA family protein [Pseudomonadota bacterium]
MAKTTGRCLCGAVTYAFEGPLNWAGHCHCESCRRQTASPMTSYLGVPNDAFNWTGVEPALFQSSPGVRRRFCPTCGTPMSYEADKFGDEIHLYAATLDDPEAYSPAFHVFTSEQLSWLHLADGLPRHATTTGGD